MFSTFANPHRFMALSKWLLPIFAVLGALIMITGWYWALEHVPPERYQGESARIMYVHVPAAWISMGGYLFMGIASLLYLILRHSIADVAAKSAAPAAALFCFVCLVTGSIWGRPTWGTFWIWDARLTSMLFLLFLILGYMALRSAFQREADAAKAGAILCLVGLINLPIIKFSVDWWNTLHQPASILRLDGPSLAPEFFWALMYNFLGVIFVFGALTMAAMRAEVYRRQYRARLERMGDGASA